MRRKGVVYKYTITDGLWMTGPLADTWRERQRVNARKAPKRTRVVVDNAATPEDRARDPKNLIRVAVEPGPRRPGMSVG